MLNPCVNGRNTTLRRRGDGRGSARRGGCMVHIDFTRLPFLSRRRQRPCASHLRSLLQGFGARDVHESEDGTDWRWRPPAGSSAPVPGRRKSGSMLAKPISAKALYERILNVVANPRPFIKTKTYFGPDRRRTSTRIMSGRNGAPEQNSKWPFTRTIRRRATFADHEVIMAAHELRKAVVHTADPDDDPVARAEAARWQAAASPRKRTMNCFAPRTTSKAKPRLSATRRSAPSTHSLCRLIEHTPDVSRIPLTLVEQHVDPVGRSPRICAARPCCHR